MNTFYKNFILNYTKLSGSGIKSADRNKIYSDIEIFIAKLVERFLNSKSHQVRSKSRLHLEMIRSAGTSCGGTTYLDMIMEVLVAERAKVTDKKKLLSLCKMFRYMIYPESIGLYAGHNKKKPERPKDVNGQYPYIPFGMTMFLEYMESFPEFTKGNSFIDVGCGIGDKTFLMKFLFPNMACSGLEYDEINSGIASKKSHSLYSSLGHLNFMTGDAMKHNFSGYDRIYTYVPLHDKDALKKFYKNIWKTLEIGAMWIEVSPQNGFFDVVKKGGEVITDTKHPYRRMVIKTK